MPVSLVVPKKEPRISRGKLLSDPNTPVSLEVLFGAQKYKGRDKFTQYWDLLEVIQSHGFLRAAMSIIGRTTVGTWFDIVEHDMFTKRAPKRHKKVLMEFYMNINKKWDNIKDYQSTAYKLMAGAMQLKYFGQCAFQLVRDASGRPTGFDFMHGIVVPNVDSKGKFQNPAFYQYLSPNKASRVEYKNPKDIIYIYNPDWDGSVIGGSDIQSLGTYTLPIDLYLQLAAREYLKNRDRPEYIYEVPENLSPEAFDEFVEEVHARWQGPQNTGRSPIVIAGEFTAHELSKYPDKIPFSAAKVDLKEEELAVAGVPGAKLGLSDSLSSANIRELRREFHESTMLPLFRIIELGFYEQVHIREFGFYGWIMKFNRPDFLTAVEQATVHMRYIQMGVYTVNEVRTQLGKPEVEGGDAFPWEDDDEEDDEEPTENPGSPPEGREDEPDSPSNTGEPTDDDQDPPRGDGHDDVTDRMIKSLEEEKSPKCRQEDESKEDCVSRKIPEIMEENPEMDQDQAIAIANDMCDSECDEEKSLDETIKAVRAWRKFIIERLKSNRSIRTFRHPEIPEAIIKMIDDALATAKSIQDVKDIFSSVINELEAFNNEKPK